MASSRKFSNKVCVCKIVNSKSALWTKGKKDCSNFNKKKLETQKITKNTDVQEC